MFVRNIGDAFLAWERMQQCSAPRFPKKQDTDAGCRLIGVVKTTAGFGRNEHRRDLESNANPYVIGPNAGMQMPAARWLPNLTELYLGLKIEVVVSAVDRFRRQMDFALAE